MLLEWDDVSDDDSNPSHFACCEIFCGICGTKHATGSDFDDVDDEMKLSYRRTASLILISFFLVGR